MYNKEYGSRFKDLKMNVRYDLKHIASLMRAEIKDAKALGLINKGYRTSVKMSGVNAISISINALPFNVALFSDEYKASYSTSSPYKTKYSPEVEQIIKRLKVIHSLWNYNNDDMMTDYFDVNYYGDVTINYNLTDEFHKEIS